ncbi:hypothetical protein PAECIP111891_01279 [Paenibacillus allorhizoplanae]|uniref:Uncharacterized protein n=1 Tax=Paenibacillus allorhizoplanae TaxID=2905648 RepID=A0ABM9C0H3_9BACL|nr:hypothetical protein PAECIP111891_01279 [Paenibacillus allorhizoplanae]
MFLRKQACKFPNLESIAKRGWLIFLTDMTASMI